MTNKATWDKGAFNAATAECSDQVPLTVNGQPVTGVTLGRDAAGDLHIQIQSQQAQDVIADEGPLVPVPEPRMALAGHEPRDQAPELEETDRLTHLQDRRRNNPADLTEEEAKELAHLEQLADVEERRTSLLADDSAGEDDSAL